MSPARRVSSSSVARASSRRLFSRMTCWERSGLDQRLGSAACCSISPSCWRSLAASKVLLERTDSVLQGRVLLLEFFNHGLEIGSLWECETRDQRAHGNYRTQAGEPIAVFRIEGRYAGEGVRSGECGASFARQAGHHAAVGVDGGGEAGVGVAQQPPAVLDGAHAGLVQMLRPGSGIAVPAIVGDVDEDLRALCRQLADFVGEDRFVADEDAKLLGSGPERGARGAARKVADSLGQASGESEDGGERDILAERHEVDLAVTAVPGAGGTDEGGGVVDGLRIVDAERTGHHPGM